MSETFNQKQYKQATPIPAKFLLPDGTVTDELPMAGGGSGTVVDVVEKDNMNAVTSNAVAEALEEKVVLYKKHVTAPEGKYLYQVTGKYNSDVMDLYLYGNIWTALGIPLSGYNIVMIKDKSGRFFQVGKSYAGGINSSQGGSYGIYKVMFYEVGSSSQTYTLNGTEADVYYVKK